MRTSIKKCPVPANTMLDQYSIHGAYVDCYSTEIPGRIPFPEFVFAFYTTSLFRLERSILKIIVSKPSTNAQARELAEGISEKFAVWQVENRKENELLMCDFRGRTRSWLMMVAVRTVDGPRTKLYFGSAVVPIQNSKTRGRSPGPGFQALLRFHKIYSMLLLYSAKTSINRHHSSLP